MSKDHNHKYSILHENYDIELSNTNDLNYNLNNNNNNNNNINLNNDLIEFCNNIGLTNDFIKALDDVGISNLNDIESMRASDITKNNGYRYLLQKLEEKTKPLHFIKFLDALDIDISNIKSSSSSSSSPLMNISTQRHQIGLMSSLPLPLPSSSPSSLITTRPTTSFPVSDNSSTSIPTEIIDENETVLSYPPSELISKLFALQGGHFLDPEDLESCAFEIQRHIANRKNICINIYYEYDCLLFVEDVDRDIATKLFWYLKDISFNLNVYFDFDSNISNLIDKLHKSLTFIPLCSRKGLEKYTLLYKDFTKEKFLILLQTSLDITKSGVDNYSNYIFPILSGCYDDGVLVKFDAFGENYISHLQPPWSLNFFCKLLYFFMNTIPFHIKCTICCFMLLFMNVIMYIGQSKDLSNWKLEHHLKLWSEMNFTKNSLNISQQYIQDDTYFTPLELQEEKSYLKEQVDNDITGIFDILFILCIGFCIYEWCNCKVGRRNSYSFRVNG